MYLAVWWLLCMALQYMVLDQIEIDLFHAATDAIVSNIILAFFCFLLGNVMKYYLPRQEKYWFLLISSILVCVIWLFLFQVAMHIILPKNDSYVDFIKSSFTIRFGAGFLLVSSLTMFSMLWYAQQDQKKDQARKAETDRLNRDAELFKLRQQLQPHFLFNSLNSISALTGSEPEKARHMIQQLSEFLRGMLKKDEQQLISLHDEMRYLELYLDIEKVRFGHRLQTDILYNEDTHNCSLPPLILQPVVENAIKFGLYDTTEDVIITVHASKVDQHLLITVTNPFDPETSRPVKGTGFGLSSISRRLFLIYLRKDLLKTEAKGDLFITQIIIPQQA